MADTLEGALTAAAESSEIIPGTTPTLTMRIDKDILKVIEKARLDVVQDGKTVIATENVVINKDGGTISYSFSQEETYRMTSGRDISIQLHLLATDDVAFKTKIFTMKVGNSLTSILIGEDNA